tara:strand:- start:13067 stop:13300 length:234 start_codon:yes stop_codon:yes gene_type:complete
MAKYTSLKDCMSLIDKYVNEFGGECKVIKEGVLGLGIVVLRYALDKKTIVIKEERQNEWSSIHTIRMYNKLPKKYSL